MRRAATFTTAIACLTLSCSAGGPSTTAEPRGLGASRAMDVVRIGGFGRVAAVAVSPTRVFVVGSGGVAVRDRFSDRWLPPIALPIEDVVRARTLAAADGSGETLWIASGSAVWVVNPSTRWVSGTFVSGDVQELLVDRIGRGAYMRANGWWLVSPTGSAAPTGAPAAGDVQRTPTAAELLRETPGMSPFAPLLTRDASLRSWELTTLARAPDRNQLWAGTDGGGLFEVDPAFVRSVQHPFGLRSDAGAIALAPAVDGAWILEAPDARSGGLALTFATDDLTSWRWLSPLTRRVDVLDLATRGSIACVATVAGPVLVDLAAPNGALDTARPDSRFGEAWAAGAAADGCWLATEAGIVRLPWPGGTGDATVVDASTTTTTGFAFSGDSVWTASAYGVILRVAADTVARGTRLSSPAGRARDVALFRDGLAVLTDDALWVTEAPARSANPRRLAVPMERIRPLRRVAADDRTIWVIGGNGAIAVRAADGRWVAVTLDPGSAATGTRTAAFASDVRDMLLTPSVVWFATRGGVVRVARDDQGMPR